MMKKQTVWLLTMLSLMIVLSAYYMLSDSSENLAYINNGQDSKQEAVPTDSTEAEDDSEVTDITNVADDELFTNIRMQIQDERNMKKERLTDVVASSSSTTNEKDEALKDIDVLEDLSSKEVILEESIANEADYDDVLVRSDEDKVHVQVKTDKLSGEQANNIMQLVRDEFGEIPVDVNFQAPEGK
jgi:stage III sporulation protein AH